MRGADCWHHLRKRQIRVQSLQGHRLQPQASTCLLPEQGLVMSPSDRYQCTDGALLTMISQAASHEHGWHNNSHFFSATAVTHHCCKSSQRHCPQCTPPQTPEQQLTDSVFKITKWSCLTKSLISPDHTDRSLTHIVSTPGEGRAAGSDFLWICGHLDRKASSSQSSSPKQDDGTRQEIIS